MFLRHARAARLAAAYLLFTVALVMVPKTDIPETSFDEANTPTNEMVVEKTASPSECGQSLPSVALRMSAQPRKFTARRVLLVHAGRLTDSLRLRQLFCSFLFSVKPTPATSLLRFGLSCGPFVSSCRRPAGARMLQQPDDGRGPAFRFQNAYKYENEN
jgi:hypothetical protein